LHYIALDECGARGSIGVRQCPCNRPWAQLALYLSPSCAAMQQCVQVFATPVLGAMPRSISGRTMPFIMFSLQGLNTRLVGALVKVQHRQPASLATGVCPATQVRLTLGKLVLLMPARYVETSLPWWTVLVGVGCELCLAICVLQQYINRHEVLLTACQDGPAGMSTMRVNCTNVSTVESNEHWLTATWAVYTSTLLHLL